MNFHDQSKSTGANKVLIGTMVGALGLIAMAALVVAAMVLYHKRGSRNYEKVPLLVDE